MKKRILQIIPTLDRAGAEKQMTMLAAALGRDEFDVHVCAMTRGGPLLEDLRRAEVPTTLIGKRWKLDPAAYWRLMRLVRHLRPDLIHTWIFAANSYGRAAGLACGVRRLVASERCVDPWKGWRDLAVDRYLARRTARIVANSPGVRDFYVRHGLPAEKFVVIHNGVEPAAPSPTSREALLAELGLPSGIKLVGLVGRLWAQKRVKAAIWSTDMIKAVRDDVHLLVIGDGPQRQRLRRFRDQIEVGDKVHFLGQRDDVARIMPHFDVLWSTSAYEGQSNSVMEAMAAGVPVVATDIPGTRDLVADGQTGFLVPLHGSDGKLSRAAFARITNNLLDDPALARRLGDAARDRILREFSVEQMVQRHVELYRQLLGVV